MKKFSDSKKLKNVITKSSSSFSQFLSNFITLKKIDKEFYLYQDNKVDYNNLVGQMKAAGAEDIPSKEELDSLIK